MSNAQNTWLIGPRMDVVFFIGTPLLIIPAFHLFSIWVPLAVMTFVVLSLSATGHHLPGFIRAYSDPAIFQRFKARLIIVPALIVLIVSLSTYYKLSLIFLLLIAWGTWHGIMQVHGFLRIYDAKAGFHAAWTARLDFWMCLAWFVQVILWSTGKKTSLLSTFYMSGGPLLSTPWVKALEAAWLVFTVLVTLAYFAWTLRNARLGQFNPRKLASLVIALCFWAYCMISVENLIVGLLLWELFHDVQYNAFVWSYNRSRVDRSLSGSRLERFLFRKDWRRISIYTACIALYGGIGFFTQDLVSVYRNQETYGDAFRQIGNLFACSALIHFYLDGFIWKVRDPKVRQDLGMAPADATPVRNFATARHWAFVIIVLGASFSLGVSEHLHWNRTQQAGMYSSLVDLVPGSGYAHFMRGTELKGAGDFEAARMHYMQAVELDTNFSFVHALAADLSWQLGDTAAAITSYEAARRLEPSDPLIVGNLADIYLSAGHLEQARSAFQNLVMLEPANAQAHYGLAVTLLQLRRGLDAKPHLERTLELDPAQPAALNYLGMVEHATGNLMRARDLYSKSLSLDPEYGSARNNLTSLVTSLESR